MVVEKVRKAGSGCLGWVSTFFTKKVLFYAITIYVIWLSMAMHRISTDLCDWRDNDRGWREFRYWMFFAIAPWVSHHTVASFNLDEKDLFEDEEHINLQYITDRDLALQQIIEGSQKKDRIVVWKNFIEDNGHLKKYQDYENFKSLVNKNDTYDWLRDYNNEHTKKYTLGDGFKRLETEQDIYMGFNYALLENNPGLYGDFQKAIGHYGDDFLYQLNIKKAVHHSFIYYGNRYATGLHQAPVSGFVIQVANTKIWRFISPKYTPYMKPFCSLPAAAAMLSGHSYLKNSTKIPYSDVVVEAGDLVYFPEMYWHEVHNMYPDKFGSIIGFRPKFDFLSHPLHAIFPPFAPDRLFGHKAFFMNWGLMRALSMIKIPSLKWETSGVDQRSKHMAWTKKTMREIYPKWSFNKWEHEYMGEELVPTFYSPKDLFGDDNENK